MTHFMQLLKKIIMYTNAGEQYVYLRRLKPFLEKIGWFRSVRERLPVDYAGNPIPWFTYSAICFLSPRISPEMTVFEYGSGNSTLWWSKQVSRIISCEHDLTWFQSMRERLPSNVEYHHQQLICGGKYSQEILRYSHVFDIIVIDGRDRVNCAKNCIGALKNNGVIIWDNSDLEKYNIGYSHLLDNGFKRLDFFGHGPIAAVGWGTAIFYRPNNCIGI